jgi:hypothetical protein
MRFSHLGAVHAEERPLLDEGFVLRLRIVCPSATVFLDVNPAFLGSGVAFSS